VIRSGTDAKVAYERPVIGNATVDARLSAKLNDLRTKIEWIDAVIKSAVAQQIKGFNLFRDSVTATDNILLTFGLALNEGITAGSVMVTLRDLFPSEQVTSTDQFDKVVSFALSVIDAVVAGDSLNTFSGSANMDDTATGTDALAMTLGRSVGEALSAADAVGLGFGRETTAETLTSTDALTLATSWQRLFADAATVADSISINASTLSNWNFSENITPAEVVALAVAITQASTTAATDGTALNYSGPRADSIGATDSIGLAVGLKAQDALGPVDGGTILMEDYANNYFAELYAGSIRTIT
jgi:hypothetical protein